LNEKRNKTLENAQTALAIAPQNIELPSKTLTKFYMVVRTQGLPLLELPISPEI